jgi:hypothetical protein
LHDRGIRNWQRRSAREQLTSSAATNDLTDTWVVSCAVEGWVPMKFATSAALLFALVGAAAADTNTLGHRSRVADATADACFSNCANANASCKRACPITFSTPCLSSCDSQMQTCREGCQRQ